MTTLDLIAAIGAAGNEDLEHSERTVSTRHRVTTSVLLVAAILAMLTATAFAVPAIRNALFGTVVKQTFVSKIFVEEGNSADVRESSVDVSLDVRMNPDAPNVLKTCYVPMLPAREWEPIPIKVTSGQELSFRTSTLLQWRNSEGDYVLFRQFAMPDYSVEQPFDSVCTGFDAEYSTDQLQLGEYTVQRITVEPSTMETLGFRGENAGLQKLYWSDGDYIFSMEVNYSMSEEELGAILESIAPVEQVGDYVAVERTPGIVLPLPQLHLAEIRFPKTLPEGYVQTAGAQAAIGEYFFLWCKKDTLPESVLELSIAPEGRNIDIQKDWETSAEDDSKTTREAGGITVLCYQREAQAQLLWSIDGADYTLKSSGPERLSTEELLQLLERFVVVTDAAEILID